MRLGLGARPILGAVVAFMVAAAAPVKGPLESVRFEDGDTIRGVAQRYLKDPDLWPQILELSGVESSATLKPGAILKIPVVQVASADAALATSLAAIQRATAEGARIFAPVEIEAAIDNRDTAVEQRGVGAWDEVVSFATIATGYAGQALDISLKQRDRAAEAVVSDVQGDVEGRAPAEPRWSSRSERDILVEFERLRTLSSSTAQVTFRDLSRLRLNPNSNAVIQQMRSDPLTGGEVTKVSLVEGDFYALLNQLSDRTAFEVEVPGLETRTNSSDFWVKHDSEASRFANYDTADLSVTSRAGTVTLGQNEGALVANRTGEAQQIKVLAKPELVAPVEGARLYNGAVALEWRGIDAAEGYWVEIAGDVDFNQMKVSQWGLRETGHAFDALGAGRYYWRVSALDRLGLPGARSLSRRFVLLDDVTPPFLTVLAPREGELVAAPEVTVSGENEIDARLAINGRYVATAENGAFSEVVTAVAGENEVRLESIDAAGNRTEKLRRFIYRPAGYAAITLDAAIPRDAGGRLLTQAGALDVRGATRAEAGSRLRLRDAAGAVTLEALIGADGAFSFAAPATVEGVAYVAELVAPGGGVEGRERFVAALDSTPPELALDAPPPAATSVRFLEIAGQAAGAASVVVNGAPATLKDGRFEALATLAPGPNAIEIVASDAVGNVAVSRFETLLDIEAPRILSARADRPAGAAGPIEITVAAQDPSGLRQVARYALTVGGVTRRGFLRCDSAAGVCRETLPPEPGALKLVEVVVEDYAGNTATQTK